MFMLSIKHGIKEDSHCYLSALYKWRTCTWHPFDRKPRGPKNRLEHGAKEKNSISWRESNPIFQPVKNHFVYCPSTKIDNKIFRMYKLNYGLSIRIHLPHCPNWRPKFCLCWLITPISYFSDEERWLTIREQWSFFLTKRRVHLLI